MKKYSFWIFVGGLALVVLIGYFIKFGGGENDEMNSQNGYQANQNGGDYFDEDKPDQVSVSNKELVEDKNGFYIIPSGERFRKIYYQVPNHDYEMTTSIVEVIGPVEGTYLFEGDSGKEFIQIIYEGEELKALVWAENDRQKRKVKSFMTSKGYLSIESEYYYPDFGEAVNNVKDLYLEDRYTGDVYHWANK